ncbi:unnamed protein product [Didymodactylos carnosus]|uniref:Uncharacterized protein n=1 Tax=Didymodactylos carnosus TaxID=1234261 RepID=A0A814QVG2_9BILA|nr:unnamed protein product [Didymodactylos carnosus]CAF1124256.1 unnamed protein product [Didymodactylos carnosus]CAF3757706.1 unnamed protein product [Didymodactylos carnosus]CAF3887779.1 unnamed protein product [Didymodactylos carnosus]
MISKVSEYTEQSALTRRSVGDNERRITEIHTAPAARITDRISRFETGDQQQSTQRGISLTKQTIDRESIDKRRQIYETDMEKRPTQGWTADRTLTDVQRPYDTADFRRRLEDTVSGTVIPPPLSPSPKDIPTISSKSTTRVQSTDRLGRSGFDAVKSALESSMTKPTTPHTSIDITIKEKRPSGYNAQTGMVSSIDSDLSVGGPSSPPIYQSTPKPKDDFNLYKKPDGNESEDELSEKEQEETTTVTEMTPSVRQRRRSRNRLRDFSSSTPGHATTFNETNMENLLSHVPISKGKGLLIELSPHVSDSQMPTKSHLKPTSSDSGIFDYSTATSIGRPSWMNTSSQFLDDNAANIRDSGIYVDQTSASSRSRRYHTSDTDLTSSEYDQKRQHQYQTQVDEPLSKSTYKYETEILQPKQLPRIADEQQRNVRRHLTGTFHTDTNTTPGTLSDYDNLANYRSGGTTTTTTARIPTKQVPITTQSRAKPLILNEIETIETETHVQFEMNRTREIKESTKTEPAPKGAPKTSKITTTNITTRTPDSSSDEALKTSRRVLLNEKPQYYTDQSKTDRIPHTQTSETYISSRPITTEIHQSYKESGAHRFSSSPSDTVTYETGRRPPSQSSQIAQKHSSPQQEEPVRIEETWFKPIQRDRSHDSLITATTSEHQRHHPQRSSIRTCSAGPRTMQVTSLSPDSQVTFGKYDSNEIIAIVRVPEMNQQQTPRPSTTVARESSTSPLTQIDRNGYSSTLRPSVRQTSMSEPELHIRAKQEAEQQQTSSKYLQQQQLVATSYIPTAEQQNRKTYERLQTLHQNDAKRDLKYLPSVYVDQETDSSIISGEPAVKGRRSRIDPYDNTDGYRHVTPPVPPTRSLSYHSAMHDQLQQQQQYPTSSSNLRPHSLHSQHRTASLGNLFGNNIEFEIEIEKRPPQQPERPTVIELNQATRAIVTTSKDGRVSIQNVTARPGNTVIINSDFHSSDRSLNRSSGYFSSDELRSQGVNTNYSSDEQSGASNNPPSSSSNLQQQGQQQTHIRRYNTKNTTASGGDSNGHSTNRLPAYYRSKHDNVEKINQILNQFRNGNGTTSSSTPVNTTPGFNDAIAQIDALYNNLDINNDKLDKTNARDYYSFNQLEPTTTNDNDDTLTSPTSQIQTPKYNFNKSGKERSTDSRRSDVLNRFDDNLAVRRSNNSNTFTNSPDGSGYKRYSSTGFQHIPNEHDAQTNGGDSIVQLVHASSAGIPHTHSTNSTIQHLISPSHHLASSSNDSPYHLHSQKQRRRHHQNNDDDRHSYSQSDLRSSSFIDESQNMNNNNNNNDNSDQSLWQPHSLRTSLTDLLVVNNPTTTPIQSQSLSSSGIVADYGSSPTNYYSSSSTPQPFTSQQNRTNQQGFRNRTSVKMVKQKNAAKKRGPLDNQGMYSEDEDSGDSPLSDSDRHQRSNLNEMTNTSAFNHSRQQQHQH